MKKIMQMALVCLLATSTAAYAGDNRASNKTCADKAGASTCTVACKKGNCVKASCNTTCTRNTCGQKKG